MRASRFAALIVLSLALAGVADDAVLASEPTAPDAAYVVTVVPGASSVEAIESADVGDGATPISPEHALTDLSPDEVAALAARADVVSVLPDAPAYAAEVTNDPCVYDGTACGYGPGQVGLRAVGAPLAWDVAAPAPVTVAVIDAGVDVTHPELAGRVTTVTGCPLLTGTVDDTAISHGTMVAGIIAAAIGNGTGIAGASRAPVHIRSYKVLSQNGGVISGSTAAVASAINCAVADGASVINLSLTASDRPELQSAIAGARAAGVVVVAASGNGGNAASAPVYPAAYPDVVAVSGVDASQQRASFANGGDWVDLAAPGTDVLSTSRVTTGSYRTLSGTSFSVPFVSAAAAQLRGRTPGLSVADVRWRIETTARPAGPGLGRGTLDMAAAVRFPTAGSPACAAGGWILDAFGGIHATPGSPPAPAGPYWHGWDIARDLTTSPGLGGGYLLDGFGGLHALAGAPPVVHGPYWSGWDIARAAARRPDGGVYVLDAFGGVHIAQTAGTVVGRGPGGPYWNGWDIARDIAIDPTDPTRGFLLDGFGGVHTWGFGDGVGVVATGYTPGQDLARRLVVRSDGATGYVIGTDGWLRPWALAGHALPPPIMASTIPYGPGQAADITADGRVSVVSSFGAAVPTGPVPCFVDEKWPGWPIVRSYASAP